MKSNVAYEIKLEYHFVLECTLYKYNDLRKQYISNIYINRPNMQKFVDLINIDNIRILKLSMFIETAFTLRTTVLYVNDRT